MFGSMRLFRINRNLKIVIGCLRRNGCQLTVCGGALRDLPFSVQSGVKEVGSVSRLSAKSGLFRTRKC